MNRLACVAVLLNVTITACGGGSRVHGDADAGEEDLVDAAVEDVGAPDPVEEDAREDPVDEFEIPEPCIPEGPELVGCPSSEGATHCTFGDEAVVITGTGEPLAIQFLGDQVGIVQSWADASWGYHASTAYRSFSLDGSFLGTTSLGAERSHAAVWTGGDFGVFPCSPGSLLRVLPSGEILDERELSGCYHWVAWTGDGFAGIGTDSSDYGLDWFMVHIGTDGSEHQTGPGYSPLDPDSPPVDIEWTGCSFVVATPWSGGHDTRSTLSTWVRGWDMADLTSPTRVDESGLMVRSKIVKAGDGLLALWTESAEDTDPLRLYARFLDQFGRPCGDPVLVDVIATGLPAGPYYYAPFFGAWADGRAIISYLRYTDGEFTFLMRSVLSDGEVGASLVEYVPTGCLSRFSGGMGSAAGADRAAFWFNYTCATDSPDDYDLRVHTCE